jgi:hypothetical protein
LESENLFISLKSEFWEFIFYEKMHRWLHHGDERELKFEVIAEMIKNI